MYLDDSSEQVGERERISKLRRDEDKLVSSYRELEKGVLMKTVFLGLVRMQRSAVAHSLTRLLLSVLLEVEKRESILLPRTDNNRPTLVK